MSLLPYKPVFNEIRSELSHIKRSAPDLFERVERQINKIVRAPELGKPLRYQYKNCRRLHVGSFVLIYRIDDAKQEIHFLEFDHHDTVYKK